MNTKLPQRWGSFDCLFMRGKKSVEGQQLVTEGIVAKDRPGTFKKFVNLYHF